MNRKQRYRRRPFLAALLTPIMIGLGQLYIGRVKRAVFFWFGFALLQLLVVLLVSSVPPPSKLDVLLPSMACLAGFASIAMVDAFVLARRLGRIAQDRLLC